MTTRNGKIHDHTYGGDTSHPASGNLVLMNDGKAFYGGAMYYRDGYAPRSAVKPEPVAEQLPPGTRVVIKESSGLSSEWFGKTGTLVERPDAVTAPYDYFATLDSDMEGAFPLALYADEVEVAPEPEPAPLAVGDRVVYTVPETFMGEPGSRAANTGLIGELGTVVEAPRNSGVEIRWDNQGRLRNSIEFVERAPLYREVTYKSYYDTPYRHYGIQRTSDGKMSCTANRVPTGLAAFRAEAPLDKAHDRPYVLFGRGMDVQPL